MIGIKAAVLADDQPIGGHSSATAMGESRWLTSWIQPSSLEVQNKYDELTNGLSSIKDKIISCWRYVATDLRYERSIKTKVSLDGKIFTQSDTWLDPAQTIRVGIANCANRSFLLTSLLQQELPSDRAWCVLGNVVNGKRDGHAWCYVCLDSGDYVLETTQPKLKQPLIPMSATECYEGIIFTNGKEVRYIPELNICEPLSYCYCLRWLEGYLDEKNCDAYV